MKKWILRWLFVKEQKLTRFNFFHTFLQHLFTLLSRKKLSYFFSFQKKKTRYFGNYLLTMMSIKSQLSFKVQHHPGECFIDYALHKSLMSNGMRKTIYASLACFSFEILPWSQEDGRIKWYFVAESLCLHWDSNPLHFDPGVLAAPSLES